MFIRVRISEDDVTNNRLSKKSNLIQDWGLFGKRMKQIWHVIWHELLWNESNCYDMRRIITPLGWFTMWWFMTMYVCSKWYEENHHILVMIHDIVCSKWTRCYRMLHAIIDEMREALPPMFSREPEDRAVRTLYTQYTVHWWGSADIITHLRQRVISKHHRGLSMFVYLNNEYDRAFMPWWWLLTKAELCIHNEWQLRCVWSTESSQTITCSIRVGAWSPKEGTP